MVTTRHARCFLTAPTIRTIPRTFGAGWQAIRTRRADAFSGRRINCDYAERRSIWEPLYKVTQMKGDGEAHPFLSPNDEFADYENWDRGNWNGEAKKPGMLPPEYARGALKIGLQGVWSREST